ncbi:MAG: lysophospholipid acyltransferase family protein [Planctomycetota bacterium]|jgi:1-acyl-sn-glycerol-3-phosphate acyltransferase
MLIIRYFLSILAWTTGILAGMIIFPLTALSFSLFNPRINGRIGIVTFRLATHGFLIWLKCVDQDKVDRSRAHVFMANHASFFDLFILAAFLPGEKRGIEAEHHFKWPLWGHIIRKAGQIPVNRSSPKASMKSIMRAAEVLKGGISILILPEGTRTTTGKMLPFKKLPFKLAKLGGADIVPIGISGTFKIKNKKSWLIRPGVARIRFGETIPAETVQSMDLEELKELTRERIAGLLS